MARPDPIQILERDHQLLRDLFSRLSKSSTVEERSELIDELAEAIENHTELEEDIFYPAFRDAAADREEVRFYFQSIEEHNLFDHVLGILDDPYLDEPRVWARIKVLRDLVLHHIEEEESEMFPLARQLCSEEQLREIGTELQDRKFALEDDLAVAE